MVLKIDFDSEEALYTQLCNQIICGIAMDVLHDGDSLPSVRQLADEIGINMHTVNKAYAVLKQEGCLRLDRKICGSDQRREDRAQPLYPVCRPCGPWTVLSSL